jgi:hypothetical protein
MKNVQFPFHPLKGEDRGSRRMGVKLLMAHSKKISFL